jgi:type II secretory pathway pseudopilin PulG
MSRRLLAVVVLAVLGIAAAVSVPLVSHSRSTSAEARAAVALGEIGEAQRRFRARAGHGGYATDLASLRTPCPGEQQGALSAEHASVAGYSLLVRSTIAARPVGTDCHGRPMTTDYYAAAEPVTPLSGRLALAMTARARIYVFIDGLAPVESDMAVGGLAVPLDTLDAFKIP